MNAREERGLVIAAFCKLKKSDEGWLVPSQSSTERVYRVDVEKQTCTCPDHLDAGHKCKHIFAVEITAKREVHADGTVTDTQSITLTKKTTYKQDWAKYNLAQATEKNRLQVLLHDLCRNLPDFERSTSKRGPKPHKVGDMIYAMAYKVYCGLSSRRCTCDMDDAHERAT